MADARNPHDLRQDRDPDWEARALGRVADLPEGPVRWLGEHLARNRECGPNFNGIRMSGRWKFPGFFFALAAALAGDWYLRRRNGYA